MTAIQIGAEKTSFQKSQLGKLTRVDVELDARNELPAGVGDAGEGELGDCEP